MIRGKELPIREGYGGGAACVRPMPVNLVPGDEELFSEHREYVCPPVRLRSMKGVGISADGIVFRGLQVMRESYLHPDTSWLMRQVRSRLKFCVLNGPMIPKKERIGRGLWFVDDHGCFFFHWLTESLPRLLVALGNGWPKDAPVLVPGSLRNSGFVSASLEAFGLEDIRYIDSASHCDELVVPGHVASTGNYNPTLIRSLRDVLLKHFVGTADPSGGERIYISRGKAPRRKISNEEETVAVLRKHGFRTVYLEEMDFAEQVRTVASASHLVSNHGAGLTNMMFIGRNARILEVRKEGDSHNNCYYSLAAAVERDYHYLNCPPVVSGEDTFSADVTVDPKKLDETLAAFVAPRTPGRSRLPSMVSE